MKENKYRKFLDEDVYFELDEAIKILEERKKDKKLHNKIKEYFGDDLLEFGVENKNFACISKYITTPNNETKYFLNKVFKNKLHPVFLEYSGKFVAKNKDKYYLTKLYFCEGENKNSEEIYTSNTVVNFNEEEGNKICDVKTSDGRYLIDVHRNAMGNLLSDHKHRLILIEDWFDKMQKKYEYAYVPFLSIFLKDAILFENYLPEDKEECKFLEKRFKPAFDIIKEQFGVRPLIVPIVPQKEEMDRKWYAYDSNFKKHFSI
jgi:hypothetical protein